jgi:hypothetical protein
MYNSQMGNGFEQQLAQRMAQARRKPTRPGFNDPYRGRPVQGDVQHQFLNRPAPPPPDLPGGAPAWQQGDMGPSSQGSGFSMNREGIFADIMDIDNRDGGRRAALKNIYEFMRTYGPSLTPAQRSLVQQKARQIRNAFYAQRGQGGMGRMHATTQVPFDPSGYNPTPR